MAVLLVGAGKMAQDYFEVLKKLNVTTKVICRTKHSADYFYNLTGESVIYGGIDNAIKKNDKLPKNAIIAVSIENLAKVSMRLMKLGIKNLLIEKPGGVNIGELKKLYTFSQKMKSNIYIAYNRRFYESVFEAEKIIKKDGDIKSVFFDFTELSDSISKLDYNTDVKKQWLLGNSSHVIDLVFFICGRPKTWKSFNQGSLDWHSSSARFSGSGITQKNIMFSYIADWESPGRWSINFRTKNHQLIFEPIEKLRIIKKNQMVSEDVEFNSKYDKKYKPGLFKQVKDFLSKNDNRLCKIKEHLENVKIYNKIALYK